MSFVDAAFSGRRICNALERHNIPLPLEAADAQALLDRIAERRPPTEVSSATITQTYLDEQPDNDIDQAVTTCLIAQMRFEAWARAQTQAGRRLVQTLMSHHETLTKSLAKIAARAITHLEKAAALDHSDVAALIRNGRDADAKIAASVDIQAGELDALYRLRDELEPPTADNIDCGVWRDPRVYPRQVQVTNTPAERYLVGLRAGAELWFPTRVEATAAAEAINAQIRAEKAREEAKERATTARFWST